jgi:hypothetical protein
MIPQIPEWLIKTLFALAIVGLVAVVAGIGFGAFYLFSHLHWK